MRALGLGCAGLLLGLLGVQSSARANGAFPDSLAVLLPQDDPQRIYVATNFGLVVSDDGGTSFDLICEEVIGTGATLYTLSAPPDDRLFVITFDGLAISSDQGCSWKVLQQPITYASDVFVDPNDPSHVLAIAEAGRSDAGTALQGVFESVDGGRSFAFDPLYIAPSEVNFTGIELARSDPRTIYGALYDYRDTLGSSLARSHDGGTSWSSVDLRPQLGASLARILAIDPDDASRVYLRVYDDKARDRLAIYHDDSQQAEVVLTLKSRMSAFLLRSDGALIVGSAEEGGFISTDGGATFAPWPNAPHLRALAERDGKIYAAADELRDGFALGVTADDGAHWQPLLKLTDIRGPAECPGFDRGCSMPFQTLQTRLDAGQSVDMAPPISSLKPDAASDAQDAGSEKPARAKGGCGCSVVARGAPAGAAGLAVPMGWLLARRRRRPKRASAG